jgi:hypothetical protein
VSETVEVRFIVRASVCMEGIIIIINCTVYLHTRANPLIQVDDSIRDAYFRTWLHDVYILVDSYNFEFNSVLNLLPLYIFIISCSNLF